MFQVLYLQKVTWSCSKVFVNYTGSWFMVQWGCLQKRDISIEVRNLYILEVVCLRGWLKKIDFDGMFISRLCSCLHSATYRLCISSLQCSSRSAMKCYGHMNRGFAEHNIRRLYSEWLMCRRLQGGTELGCNDMRMLSLHRPKRSIFLTCVTPWNASQDRACWVLNRPRALWLSRMVLVMGKVWLEM